MVIVTVNLYKYIYIYILKNVRYVDALDIMV